MMNNVQEINWGFKILATLTLDTYDRCIKKWIATYVNVICSHEILEIKVSFLHA